MTIQICIGSACHLKGSKRVVELFQKAVAQQSIEDKITLAASFCSGQCNRSGVTVTVDGEIFTGITPESFPDFFENTVLPRL